MIILVSRVNTFLMLTFCVCVWQVLALFPQVQLSVIYQLIHAHLESTAGFKGYEERGLYFGRVFSQLALLRSGRLETNVSALLGTNTYLALNA